MGQSILSNFKNDKEKRQKRAINKAPDSKSQDNVPLFLLLGSLVLIKMAGVGKQQ